MLPNCNECMPSAMNTYAVNSTCKQQPDAASYANGVIPLDTLAAQWWNWLWEQITLNEAKISRQLSNIWSELFKVLDAMHMSPDDTDTQLLAALKELIAAEVPQASTSNYGLVKYGTCAGQLNEDVNGIACICGFDTLSTCVGTGTIINNTDFPSGTGTSVIDAINALHELIGSMSTLSTSNQTSLVAALNSFISLGGQANGYATLDVSGRIPYSQLPESAVEYKGTWNASTNTPTLSDGVGTNGDMYIVSVGGLWNGITFNADDRIMYTGATATWDKIPGGSVYSVNGQVGAVCITCVNCSGKMVGSCTNQYFCFINQYYATLSLCSGVCYAFGYNYLCGPNIYIDECILIGRSSCVDDDYGIAIGYNATAKCECTIAIGAYTLAGQDSVIAIGSGVTSTGCCSIGIGDCVCTSSCCTIAIGTCIQACCTNTYSNILIGECIKVPTCSACTSTLYTDSGNNVLIGSNIGFDGISVINNPDTTINNSIIIGHEITFCRASGSNICYANNVIAIGYHTHPKAPSSNTISIGSETSAESCSIAIGYGACSSCGTVAIGFHTTSSASRDIIISEIGTTSAVNVTFSYLKESDVSVCGSDFIASFMAILCDIDTRYITCTNKCFRFYGGVHFKANRALQANYITWVPSTCAIGAFGALDNSSASCDAVMTYAGSLTAPHVIGSLIIPTCAFLADI